MWLVPTAAELRGIIIKSADTIYVPEGDTIIVRAGTYTRNVVVNKSLTIQSENGSAVTTVEVNSSDNHVFEVTTDYVNISGFTMAGATWVVDDDGGVDYMSIQAVVAA